MIKTKKAQIGTTITWAVAFTIILFLMVIFLVITTALSGKELFNKNEVNFEESVGNLDYQGQLIMFLNYPIEVEGQEMKVRDLIGLWDSDKKKYEGVLESEVEEILTGMEDEFFYKVSLQKRGFELVIYSNVKGESLKQLIRIGSENYKDSPNVPNAEGKGELAGAYVFVPDFKTVYVTLWASHSKIEVENE